MDERTFGEQLADERRRRGLSIDQVSDSLRIRPDILASLENDNYDTMPLKGHARNMVSSYARFLGLNSAEVTSQFLREYHAYEDTLSRTKQNRYHSDYFDESISQHNDQDRRSQRPYRRREPSGSLDGGYDSRSSSAQRRATASARRTSYEGRDRESRRSYPAHKKRGGSSGTLSALTSHPLIVIVGLAIVLAVVLILWAVLSNSCSRTSETAPNIAVTGVTSEPVTVPEDTTTDDATDTADDTTEDATTPQPFTLKVVLPEGEESWIEISVDGVKVLAETVTGPWEGTYDVTDTTEVRAGTTGVITVYRNDEVVTLDNSTGIDKVTLSIQDGVTTTDE